MARIVVGVSGASGIILAFKSVQAIAELGIEVELVLTPQALYTATLEMGKGFSTAQRFLQNLPEKVRSLVKLHAIQDVGASICSGSYLTDGMLLIPCSMSTVAALSMGLADNCLRRAADVTLKERRPLVIVPRESPFSDIHLENMLRLSRRGASIVPPIPAWYTQPKTVQDIENFIVGKALDLLKVKHDLYPRWEGSRLNHEAM